MFFVKTIVYEATMKAATSNNGYFKALDVYQCSLNIFTPQRFPSRVVHKLHFLFFGNTHVCIRWFILEKNFSC